MRALVISCLLIVTCFYSTVGQNEQIQISKPGVWHEWQVKINPVLTWYGLFQKGDQFRLNRVSILITDVHDPDVDGPDERTGKLIGVVGSKKPILLVAGDLNLKEGPIEGQSHGYQLMAPQRSIWFYFGDEQYEINSFGRSSGPNDDIEETYEDYGIRLIGPHGEQVILDEHYFYGSGPGLVWTGDLDRDGQVDLLVDCICEDRSTNLALFLSSKAEAGDLVKMAAIWRDE